MNNPENIFENIIVAAKRSIDWKLNLILTPAELEVLVAEVARLRAVVADAIDLNNKLHGMYRVTQILEDALKG